MSIRHKGVARFVEKGDVSKLDQRMVGKIAVQLTLSDGDDAQ